MFFDILNVWRARRKIDGSSKLKICTVFKAVYDITLLKSQRGLRTKPLIDGSHQSTHHFIGHQCRISACQIV
jgi:hypothetical protein